MKKYKIVNEYDPSTGRDKLTLDGFQRPAWVIYALCDPSGRTDARLVAGTVRYVGYTKDADERFKGHLRNAKGRRSAPVYEWIRKIQREGRDPLMVILHHSQMGERWQDVETDWICRFGFGKDNCHLLNLTPGGEGILLEGEAGEAIREKLRQASRRPENLARLQAWRNSPEIKARVIDWLNSHEGKARLDAWRNSPENLARLGSLNRSPEAKARLAANGRCPENVARLTSPEYKARLATWQSSAELKVLLAAYGNSPDNKARLAALSASPEGKARHAANGRRPENLARLSSPENQARLTAWRSSPEHKAKTRSQWAAAKAAGCRTLKEYAALLKATKA